MTEAVGTPAFLEPEEVQRLTGRERYQAQIRWLRDHGWVFEVNADGQPVVGRRYAEERLGAGRAERPAPDVDLSGIAG